MTEGNTQLTLHDESIEFIINLLEEQEAICRSVGAKRGVAADKIRGVRGTIESQYTSTPDAPNRPGVIAFAGLPGAGKTFLGNKLAEILDCPVVSMGDTVREKFTEQFGSEPQTGDEIREWVEELRDENSCIIPEWTVDDITRNHEDEAVVVVEGIRTEADLQVLSKAFSPFHLIEVQAQFLTRLNRIRERGREGEENYSANDLHERDDQEASWGIQQVLDDGYADIIIRNERSKRSMMHTLENVVESNLPYDVQNPIVEPLSGYNRPISGFSLTIEASQD